MNPNLVQISGLGGCNCGAPAASGVGRNFASSGVGEYFASNGMGEYFASSGVGEYFASNGMGAYARPMGADEEIGKGLPKWVPVALVGTIVLGGMWLIMRMEGAEA